MSVGGLHGKSFIYTGLLLDSCRTCRKSSRSSHSTIRATGVRGQHSRHERCKHVPTRRHTNIDELNFKAAGPSGSSQTPIFELGRVEFPGGIPAPIISIAVCSDILAVAFANNQFYMLDLQKPEYIMKFELPKKTSELTIRKLFLDPTGKHLLLNSTQGETWYLHRSWKKPKPLKRFNSYKLVLESVAWNRTSPHTTVTGPFLLGTSTGSIYETFLDAGDDFFKSQEKFLRRLYTLMEGSPVVGLGFELFPPSDAKKCLVIATTPSRIYQFSGLHESKGGDSSEGFQATFSKYKESEPCTRSNCVAIEERLTLSFQ
jgi:hypothetical protein